MSSKSSKSSDTESYSSYSSDSYNSSDSYKVNTCYYNGENLNTNIKKITPMKKLNCVADKIGYKTLLNTNCQRERMEDEKRYWKEVVKTLILDQLNRICNDYIHLYNSNKLYKIKKLRNKYLIGLKKYIENPTDPGRAWDNGTNNYSYTTRTMYRLTQEDYKNVIDELLENNKFKKHKMPRRSEPEEVKKQRKKDYRVNYDKSPFKEGEGLSWFNGLFRRIDQLQKIHPYNYKPSHTSILWDKEEQGKVKLVTLDNGRKIYRPEEEEGGKGTEHILTEEQQRYNRRRFTDQGYAGKTYFPPLATFDLEKHRLYGGNKRKYRKKKTTRKHKKKKKTTRKHRKKKKATRKHRKKRTYKKSK